MCVCVCVHITERVKGNERFGWRDAERENKWDRHETWLWLNCPLPFSLWMIPLSWHNPSKICLFSIPALKISQSTNQFLSLHCNQVIVLVFKGGHSQPTFDKSLLRGLVQLDRYLRILIIQLICLHILYMSSLLSSLHKYTPTHPPSPSILHTFKKLAVSEIAWSCGHTEPLNWELSLRAS